MSDAVDHDTEAAVQAAWASSSALEALFPHGPSTGRLKSPQVRPYAQLACASEPGRTQHYTGGVRKDCRKVTLTLYGINADVTQGLALVLSTFNLATTLRYPSRARFVKWWPLNDGQVEEDPDTKDGQDIWRAVVEALVYSVRSDTSAAV